jgi:hypothetical protein
MATRGLVPLLARVHDMFYSGLRAGRLPMHQGLSSNVLRRRVRFLARPELVVHEQPTSEDLEAERIIKAILLMYGSSEEIRVIKWGQQQVEWVMPDRLPAIRTAGGVFHGLEAIKRIAAVERRDWQRAEAQDS